MAHACPDEQPRPQADEIALLLAEADHWIRNLLAMVEAIVRQTRSDTVEEYRTKVLNRISGFNDFYQVTARASAKNVPLASLLKRAVGSYYWERGQMFAAGPDVIVRPEIPATHANRACTALAYRFGTALKGAREIPSVYRATRAPRRCCHPKRLSAELQLRLPLSSSR